MNKDNLLKMVAESGYNLGYGAKKHFATFDLTEKLLGWLGFFTLAVGSFALFNATLATPTISAWMLLFGFSSIYINRDSSEKKSLRPMCQAIDWVLKRAVNDVVRG
jgi:hypothetical protein